MILEVFALLIGISIILVIIGLARPSESYQALVGFFFMFLLSFVLINGTLEYDIGFTEYFVYGNNFSGYHWDYTNPLEPRPQDPTIAYLFHTNRTTTYKTTTDDTTTRTMGKYMAIATGLGFAGVLFSLKKTNWRKE